MMTKRSQLIFVLCAYACAALLVGSAHAEVYKWIDADGKTQYGDAPPKSAKATVVSGGVTVVPATVVPKAAPTPQSAPAEGSRAVNSTNPASAGPKADSTSAPVSAPVDPAVATRQDARARAIERCKSSRGVDCENEVDAQTNGQPNNVQPNTVYMPGVIPGWSQPPIRPVRPPPSNPRPAEPVAKQKARPALTRETASAPVSEPRAIKPMR